MKLQSLAIGALLAAAAVPASAVTVAFTYNTADTAVNNVVKTSPYFTATVSAVRFTAVPDTLTLLSQTTTPAANTNLITRTAGGLGIQGGGSNTQMDTNNPGTAQAPLREAFLVTGSAAFYLTNLTLTSVDSDDTLQIYGVRPDGKLVNFTYGSGTNAVASNAARTAGAIIGGAGGSLLNNTRSNANAGTNSFGTGIVTGFGKSPFLSYLITTRVGGDVQYLGTGGQGFALSALTATVPEPATWAMLVVGFGLVGFARRRRATAVAA